MNSRLALCLAALSVNVLADVVPDATRMPTNVTLAAPGSAPVPFSQLPRLGFAVPVKTDGLSIALKRSIPPSTAQSLSVYSYTEYSATLTNLLPDREMIVSDAALIVGGERRNRVLRLGDILREQAPSAAAISGGATAVGGALGLPC